MKNKIFPVLLGVLLLMLGTAAVVQQTTAIYVLNTVDAEVKIKARSGADQTAPFLEMVKGNTPVFVVSANGGIAAPGIQSGYVISAADGTVTNTFATAFASRPVVSVTQYGALTATVTNWLVSVTETNFVLSVGAPSRTNFWIAIGTP